MIFFGVYLFGVLPLVKLVLFTSLGLLDMNQGKEGVVPQRFDKSLMAKTTRGSRKMEKSPPRVCGGQRLDQP